MKYLHLEHVNGALTNGVRYPELKNLDTFLAFSPQAKRLLEVIILWPKSVATAIGSTEQVPHIRAVVEL